MRAVKNLVLESASGPIVSNMSTVHRWVLLNHRRAIMNAAGCRLDQRCPCEVGSARFSVEKKGVGRAPALVLMLTQAPIRFDKTFSTCAASYRARHTRPRGGHG